MLYADEAEDGDGWGLFYKCKICDYQERAQDGNEFENCVYKTDLEAKATNLVVSQDIVHDPTLQKRVIDKCLNTNKVCKNKEVVTFYHITKENFDLIYVCTKCKFLWRQREIDDKYDIGDESDPENYDERLKM